MATETPETTPVQKSESKAMKWIRNTKDIWIVLCAVGVICALTWSVAKPYVKNSLGVTQLESESRVSEFVDVLTVCKLGGYTPEEVKKIKSDYKLGRLNMDSLAFDWWEK